MLDDFDASISPRFKEVTALVRAVHRWVQEADARLLAASDLDDYFDAVLRRHVNGSSARINSVWGVDENTCQRKLLRIAKDAGFAIDGSGSGVGLDVDAAIVRALSNLNPATAKQRFLS